MRAIQRNPVARLVAALLAGGGLTLVAWRVGAHAVVALFLFAVLTAAVFVVLTIAPDAIALRRRHYWRWWWRASDDEGPFWPGTRIPRGRKRPR
jgi:hypothetical protein